MINELLIKKLEIYLKIRFKDHKTRLQHIYNVKKVAITLGKIYNENIPKLIVASYLHDVTKIYSKEKNLELAGNIINGRVPYPCIHAYSACELAKDKFNITDVDVLNAIKYHCSGRKAMSLLEKIIFVSDFIEEDRKFASRELRDLAKTDLDFAVYKIMLQTKKYILKNNQKFSEYTEEAIIYYQNKLEELHD